jgi:hypothetical protein
LSPEIIHFSIVDATVPFEVPFALPTEGLGIVETLEEHFEIMNLEVDIPEDYVGQEGRKEPRKGRLHPQLRNVLSLVTKVPEKLLSLALVAMI